MLREIKLLLKHPIYIFCMVVLPIFVAVIFTSMMNEGQPEDMPIGVVDLDNTSVIAKSRRDIARMITILEERKKAENK